MSTLNRPQTATPQLASASSATRRMPQLRNYAYLKLKDQVLIVDAISRKIVDMFSETQPLT